MSRKALHETLDRLHAELESSGPVDPELRGELERALAEIREVVARGRPGPAHASLRSTLEALALRFEQSHPRLTQSIAGVVGALGAMGI